MSSKDFLGVRIDELKEKGTLFGEITLANDDNRTATVIAANNVLLLTITKEYCMTLKKKHEKEI